MKKISIIAGIITMLIIAGCSDTQGEKTSSDAANTASAELKIETTPSEDLDKVSEIQETGNIRNCQKLEQENLRKQCELTIQAEKENAKKRSATSQP